MTIRPFSECKSLTSVAIPNGVTSIREGSFCNCTSLEITEIPDSITTIERNAFWHCNSLMNITFAGTIEQWKKITKGETWNKNVPATVVVCSDGEVSLN